MCSKVGGREKRKKNSKVVQNEKSVSDTDLTLNFFTYSDTYPAYILNIQTVRRVIIT